MLQQAHAWTVPCTLGNTFDLLADDHLICIWPLLLMLQKYCGNALAMHRLMLGVWHTEAAPQDIPITFANFFLIHTQNHRLTEHCTQGTCQCPQEHACPNTLVASFLSSRAASDQTEAAHVLYRC